MTNKRDKQAGKMKKSMTKTDMMQSTGGINSVKQARQMRKNDTSVARAWRGGVVVDWRSGGGLEIFAGDSSGNAEVDIVASIYTYTGTLTF